jgi:light-regulated signal transduction histidine kinase (bacteriophytochrome)
MGNATQERREDEIDSCVALQRKLDAAGAEFEEFIALAAHNLRESLREIASFSQLMAETYTGRLDSDADLCLGHIQQGAANMQSLLTDVVSYATGASGQPSRTDMEGVLQQALLMTDKQIAARSAAVTHDPLPAVMGDFEMLSKVLHHLIRNAIEYCVADSPRIHIACRLDDLECAFSVKDNGPGIEPAFQRRVFGVFKRLHGKEYPGNGLGLAFCKKAIEWHTGRIWVESKPGEGSTLYFTLPLAG